MTAMKTATTRYYYVDNLRVTIIALVIVLHLAVTYSNLGLWYYNEKVPATFFSHIFFGLFQTFTQGFSMGLLFLVAGYFTPGALDKKGFGRFVADRFKRLGLPSLFYLLFVTPFIIWVEIPPSIWTGGATDFFDFYRYYIMTGGLKFIGIGPMWFAVALLIFSIVYALVRAVRPPAAAVGTGQGNSSFAVLAGLTLVVAAGAFLIRLFFPIGTIFWGMQLCFFSQYIVLFIAGILAYRANFFERVTSATGRKWLVAGLVIGLAGILALRFAAGIYELSTQTVNLNASKAFFGGFSWQSVSFALLESFVAVSMTVGLMALFRDRLNYGGNLARKLSDSAFAVYVFHPPTIIAVSLAMATLLAPPVMKWALASIICVPLCFILAYYVLIRVPLLKKIL